MIVETDAARDVEALFAKPTKVLAIASSKTTTTEQIERYLNDGVVLSQVLDYPAWVAIVPASWAQFFADRLSSGLHGATVHDTIDEAMSRIADVLV